MSKTIEERLQKIENELYYKAGDTFSSKSLTAYPAFITGGGTDIIFTVFVTKKLTNIKSITINKMKLAIRGQSGNYILSNRS